MKNTLKFFLSLAFVALCAQGLAKDKVEVVAYRNCNVSNFDVEGLFSVEVKKGDLGSIYINTHPDLVQYISHELKPDGTLTLKYHKMPRGLKKKLNRGEKYETWVDVVTSNVTGVKAAGQASFFFNDYDFQNNSNCSINLSGMSKLSGIKFESKRLTLTLSGVASLRDAYLEADRITIKTSGTAEILHVGLHAKELNISESGASSVDMNVDCEKSDFVLSGSSKLTISGDMTQQKIKTSGSSVIEGRSFKGRSLKGKSSGSSRVDCNVSNTIQLKSSGGSTIKNYGRAAIVQK